ncbi:hypothetical protein MXD61_09200 [Frankia sp. AgPm24]|nr:hypothetical protein [Frankia sp. AgPm24]MCK9922057.1 hypothetical protein [Frankia sp. AgPm24]
MRSNDVAGGPGPAAADEGPPSRTAAALVWDVVVTHADADVAWARWLSWHLADAGYRVTTAAPVAATPGTRPPGGLLLVLWSAAYQRQVTSPVGGQAPPADAPADPRALDAATGLGPWPARQVLLVRLADQPRPAPYAGLLAFDLFGLDATTARDWLLRQITTIAAHPAADLVPPPLPSSPSTTQADTHPVADTERDPATASATPAAGTDIEAPAAPAATRADQPHRGFPDRPAPPPPRRTPVVLGTPQLVATLRQERGHPLAVTFSPAAPLVVTAGTDTCVHLWQLPFPDPPRLAATVGYGRRINQEWARVVTFSPDGHTLAAAGDAGTTVLWRLTATRPQPLLTLTGHRGHIHDLDFSPGGTLLATAGDDRAVLLWDLADPDVPTRAAILAGHRAPVRAVAFSPDGTLLATAAEDRTVTLWDLADPTHPAATVTLTGARGPLHTVAFSPDGDTLAVAGRDRVVRLYSVAEPTRERQIAAFGEHRRAVHAVAFSPDGHLLATASADRTVTVRILTDPDNPGPPLRLAAHHGAVHAVAFAPDSRLLATASADRTTALWDLFPDEPAPAPSPT